MGTGGGTRIPLWISILALAFTQVKGREILWLMFLLIYRIYSLLQDLKLFFLGSVKLMNLLHLCKIFFSVTNTSLPKKRKLTVLKICVEFHALILFSPVKILNSSTEFGGIHSELTVLPKCLEICIYLLLTTSRWYNISKCTNQKVQKRL